jgi:hypothetical protein
MAGPKLVLTGVERAKYFAPVALCAYVAALCVALVITSLFLVSIPNARAVTAAGAFGLVLSAALGAIILAIQLRELRFTPVVTPADAVTNHQAVLKLAEAFGWRITGNEPGRSLRLRTRGSFLHDGELVVVQFDGNEVRVASICDPAVGFSLVGQRRCAEHRDLVIQALSWDA